MTSWTRTTDGTTNTAVAEQTRPGVYEITGELLHQLMQETGWTLNPEPCRPTVDGWCAEHSTSEGPAYCSEAAR